MALTTHARRATGVLCGSLLAVGVAACGSAVSTSNFKGETHAVAQTIANLQADATASDQKKICSNDLAGAVVARLGGIAGCEQAIKNQLSEIDNLEANVETIQLGAGDTTATASVKSIYGGKSAITKVALVKEGGKWKVSGLQ